MTARISGDSRASAWPMSPYSTDSSTWSSAAGTAPAFSNTAATLRRRPQPRHRGPPPQGGDGAVAAKALRSLPDGDEGVLNRVRHEVTVVAPPGEPDREPAGVAFVERAEGAHIAFGHGEKQRRVARAAV